MDLEQTLQEIGKRIEQGIPSRDSRRTEACPSLSTLALQAERGEPESLHSATCPYCQAVLHAVRRQQQPVRTPAISVPITGISQELRDFAAYWLQQNQPEEGIALAGEFDAEGTLRLSLDELTLSGRVKVRLLAYELPVPLLETEITGSHWETTITLPGWNLRNVRIARECIELVAA